MSHSERLKHWLKSLEPESDTVESPSASPSNHDRYCESDSDWENLSDKHRRFLRRSSTTESTTSIFSSEDSDRDTLYQSDLSMSESYYTAGQGDGKRYRKQLKTNGVEEIDLANSLDPELDSFRLVFKPSCFSAQVNPHLSREI